MQEKKKEIHQYLSKKVNIFVQPLVYDIVKKRPPNPVKHAINWLKEYLANPKNSPAENSDSENDQVEELQFDKSKLLKKKLQGQQRSRMGISQEVFGCFNKKDLFIPKVVPKSQEAKLLILTLLRNSILFRNLDYKDEQAVINAMIERLSNEGETVIKQGEDGDILYIVSQGQFDCYKFIDGQQKYLKTYSYGDSFGQLSLMYNAPRAATIISKKDGKLFGLDRLTFSQIVKNATAKKRQLYQNVLNKIEVFSQFNQTQKEQFCDILKQEKYQPGQYIIKQGEFGDHFYIIIQGNLVAQKLENGDSYPKIVYHYKEGDYFGELALLHDVSRQASVKALTPVRVASIGRESFKRMVGDVQQILKRNEQRYKIYQSKKAQQ